MGLPTPKMPLPGYRLIADNSGSYVDDVNNIRLSDKFTLTRNAADPSAAIDLDLSVVGAGFQPLDSDLTAIAALSTTAYGRALLALANGNALANLLPNSGNAQGRLVIPVQIDQQALSGANAYTFPAIVADTYREISIKFVGRVTNVGAIGENVLFRVNGDTGGNYNYVGSVEAASSVTVSSAVGATSAKIGQVNTTNASTFELVLTLFPVNTGNPRTGSARTSSIWDSAANAAIASDFSFEWTNTANGVTSATVFFGDAATLFTGNVYVTGIPA